MFRFLENIKHHLVQWCLTAEDVSVGVLHEHTYPHACAIYDDDALKFIEQTTPDGLFVNTPSGFQPIAHTHKTVPYRVWRIETPDFFLECADEHIVIGDYYQQVYVKNLTVGSQIYTINGLQPVLSVVETDRTEYMYDIELSETDHIYYTNGILSHNSQTSAAYLLWYAAFRSEKTVLIASNKNDNAMEMIYRIRFMYERMPHWLKPGLTEDGWNKHNIGFDNGSRIISTATTENSGRGLSISLLFCLGGETEVTVKDTKTGEVDTISMEQLYEKVE